MPGDVFKPLLATSSDQDWLLFGRLLKRRKKRPTALYRWLQKRELEQKKKPKKHSHRVATNKKKNKKKKKHTGLPLITHFKIPWLFPDCFLTFYPFPYPLTDQKKSFLFFTLMVLTVSLQIWGLLLKERICSPRKEMGLHYLMGKYTFSPSWTE